MSSAAQEQNLFAETPLEATGTDGAPLPAAAALRQVASERLAAHRRRRAEAQAAVSEQVREAASRRAQTAAAVRAQSQSGASRVRETVAARYQKSVSYREFLAEEANRALQKAEAEAEVAARNVQAVAAVQSQLLQEIDAWPAEPETAAHAGLRDDFAHAMADIAVAATESMHLSARVEASPAAHTGFTVKLYEELPAPVALQPARVAGTADTAHDAAHLDDEIAFRFAPEFQPATPAEPITGNVIEFPRQLVAARKARPRLAEGPLLAESAPQPQLRIFEVEPEQFSSSPEPAEALAPANAAGWQSLVLDTAPGYTPQARAAEQAATAAHPAFAVQAAPLSLRLMAFAVDAIYIAAALTLSMTAVAALCPTTLRALPLPMVAVTVAAMLAAFTLLFQLLFFTLADATPGMRYARLAFCTFGDSFPPRRAMRRRIFAVALAACPLGLGLIWAWMDDERLGWHDRISRMYPRAY